MKLFVRRTGGRIGLWGGLLAAVLAAFAAGWLVPVRTPAGCRLSELTAAPDFGPFSPAAPVVAASDAGTLFCGIVLRIDDFNIDSEFFCFFFNAFTYGYEERVVECGDGEADGSCFFAVSGFCSFVTAAAAGSEHCQYCDGSY